MPEASGLYKIADGWRELVGGRKPATVICGPDGTPYMEHYPIGPRLRIHHILSSDPQSDLHDHPWNYRSLLLDGSYVETSAVGERQFEAGDLLVRAAGSAHRLTLDAPVWTLFKFGEFARTWGYHTSDGWVSYRAYLR